MHDLLRELQGQRSVLGDRGSDLQSLVHELLGRHDVVDEADLLGLVGVHQASGQQHVHGGLARNVAGHADQAAGGGDQADLGLGQAEAGMLGSHDDVAGDGDLHAAAGSNAVDGADRRLRAQTVGDAAEAVIGDGHALAAAGQLGEVLASAEGLLAGAGDHDDADALILLRLVHDVFHGGRGHCIDSVALLGAVDAHDEHAVLAKVGDDLLGSVEICHCSSFYMDCLEPFRRMLCASCRSFDFDSDVSRDARSARFRMLGAGVGGNIATTSVKR